MEDVLDVYHRPFDPRRPLICLDETSRQLLAESRPALAAGPGRAARHDPEYVRGGVVNLFLVCEPLRGWREVRVSDRRTRIDWAHCVREVVDVHYPDAEQIVLVMDNLTIQNPCVPLRGVPARGGQAHRGPAGHPLHAEARQLAEHGRNRAQRAAAPVPRPETGHAGSPGAGGGGLDGGAQHQRDGSRLAFHHRRCPDQTHAALPRN